MKIAKSRLIKIIREEITEARFRQKINGIITELTGTSTAAGAKKSGYKSADTKSKEADYNTKSADYDTKKTDYDTKKAAVDDTKKYKSTSRAKGARAVYASTNTAMRTAGYGPWITNPDYTSQVADRDAAETAKDSAETQKDSAKSTLDTAKASDLEKTVPKQKPPTGGGAGFGKGKSAGKGKGKKKK